MSRRQRRWIVVLFGALSIIISSLTAMQAEKQANQQAITQAPPASTAPNGTDSPSASLALEQLPVKGRAPKTGYSREQFGDGWNDVGDCDVRNVILARDMTEVVTVSATDCTVVSGHLQDVYTGKDILFSRGVASSSAVQIDHVVALSDAWQKGAQQLTPERRVELANDPLELVAVDGPANNQKSDGDAATWLPPNKAYRCRYIARQIAVKRAYSLWVTEAERDAMRRVLGDCPEQKLPVVNQAADQS